MNKTYIRCLVNAGITIILLLSLMLPTIAEHSPQNKTSSRLPDVLVWIDMRATGPSRISLTYAKLVPKNEVEAELALILRETGWTAFDINYSIPSNNSTNEPPMTTVEFSTPSAVNLNTGILLVAPIVKALKKYKRIEVLYLTPPDFTFVGPKNFENKYVKIDLIQGNNPYRYLVNIKNPRFHTLEIPAVTPEENAKGDKAKLLLIILAVITALLTGFVTFLLASSVTRRKASNTDRRS